MCRLAAAAPTATWWDRFKPITLLSPAATLSITTFNWHAWVEVWEPWSVRPTAARKCNLPQAKPMITSKNASPQRHVGVGLALPFPANKPEPRGDDKPSPYAKKKSVLF